MPSGLIGMLKLILVVMIGIVVVKLGTRTLASKFPNKVTKTMDTLSTSV